jgi:hypothetical protein
MLKMNMRFFVSASILLAIIFAAAAMPSPGPDPTCVSQCRQTDTVCKAMADTGRKGCCEAKCMGGTALEGYKNRNLKTSTSLKNPVATFKDKDYNSCVQWCRTKDSDSAAWGSQGLYGYCENKCNGPDYLQKFHSGLLKK